MALGLQLNGGLGEDFTVVSFDPRGYGASRPPARDFPLDFYARDADDAKALMAQLGTVPRPALQLFSSSLQLLLQHFGSLQHAVRAAPIASSPCHFIRHGR